MNRTLPALVPVVLCTGCVLLGVSPVSIPPTPSDTGTAASETGTRSDSGRSLTETADTASSTAGTTDSSTTVTDVTELCPRPSTTIEVSGGMAILTGVDLAVLSRIDGPAEDCGEEPPLLLSDLTGDEEAEVGLICAGRERCEQIHVLDGMDLQAGLASSLSVVQADIAYRDGAAVVGDLNGDGLDEVGFAMTPPSLRNTTNLRPWVVLDGASLLGVPSVHEVRSQWSMGGLWPVPSGDLDGDGTPDMLIGCQYFVSGAQLMAGGVDLPDDAFRTVTGADDHADVAMLGDIDGDGAVDVATSWSFGSTYGGPMPAEAAVTWGDAFGATGQFLRIESTHQGRERDVHVESVGDLDGDGLPELAVLLQTWTSSKDHGAELAVVPGSVLALGLDVDAALYALGGVEHEGATWNTLRACDMDGDGLAELITFAGIWRGTELLVPGSLPVGPGVGRATCAGDLDGLPGEELLVGEPV